ncbi:MAG: host attachment protein [Patescibacteria group bacterium]|jgi:protein required for attachment to host cells
MQLSDHFLPYLNPTLLIVTNNESAKIFKAQNHEIDEIELLVVGKREVEGRGSGTPNDGPPDYDELKHQQRLELYKTLSDYLLQYTQKNPETELILCAPEANKGELQDAMHRDVQKKIVSLVPKNLASLPTDQIIRILQEHRT